MSMETHLEELSEDWTVVIDADAVTVTSRRSGRTHRYERRFYRSLAHTVAAAHAGEPPARST